MRRLIVMVLMLLVPIQFAWSAVQNLHGHTGSDLPALGFHSHDGDHDHADVGSNTTHDMPTAGSGNSSDGDNGHPGGHYHPIYVSIVIETDVTLAETPRGAPPRGASVTFTSRIPPLFDWPPSARC